MNNQKIEATPSYILILANTAWGFLCFCACLCMCVCERERARECGRERVCVSLLRVCVNERERKREREGMCVFVCDILNFEKNANGPSKGQSCFCSIFRVQTNFPFLSLNPLKFLPILFPYRSTDSRPNFPNSAPGVFTPKSETVFF